MSGARKSCAIRFRSDQQKQTRFDRRICSGRGASSMHAGSESNLCDTFWLICRTSGARHFSSVFHPSPTFWAG